jgi:hypothetical protein
MISRLPLIAGFACYLAINLYLWSLPISQPTLFVITLPLGVLFFGFAMWCVMRSPVEK